MGSARSEGHRKAILSTNGNGKACSFLIIVLFFYQISLCNLIFPLFGLGRWFHIVI